MPPGASFWSDPSVGGAAAMSGRPGVVGWVEDVQLDAGIDDLTAAGIVGHVLPLFPRVHAIVGRCCNGRDHNMAAGERHRRERRPLICRGVEGREVHVHLVACRRVGRVAPDDDDFVVDPQCLRAGPAGERTAWQLAPLHCRGVVDRAVGGNPVSSVATPDEEFAAGPHARHLRSCTDGCSGQLRPLPRGRVVRRSVICELITVRTVVAAPDQELPPGPRAGRVPACCDRCGRQRGPMVFASAAAVPAAGCASDADGCGKFGTDADDGKPGADADDATTLDELAAPRPSSDPLPHATTTIPIATAHAATRRVAFT